MARTKQLERALKMRGGKTTAVFEAARKKGVEKKPRRFKSGTVALREIRKMQKSTDLLIPRAVVDRLVKELVYKCSPTQMRVTERAVEMFRHLTEDYVVHMFETAYNASLHSGRVTMLPRDVAFYKKMVRAFN